MADTPLQLLSSMATRQLLADLATAWSRRTGRQVDLVSIGGVDAARRVAAGEPFDVVVLADEAIARLIATGAVAAANRTPLAHSGVAACVRSGATPPALATADDVRQAVLAAPGIGYSTGPSGSALLKLFARWGLADVLAPKLVQAQAGVPVAAMVAAGNVALGFQQLSELLHVPGIAVIGPLPDDIQITTTFTGAVCTRASQPGAAADFLRFLASLEASAAKRQQGMTPA